MLLGDLRQLAGELNIADTAKMRKGDLIAAIKERQGGGPAPQLSLPTTAATSTNGERPVANGTSAEPAQAESTPAAAEAAAVPEAGAARRRRSASRPAGAPRRAAGP